MTTTSKLKLSANEIASIIVQSEFSDAELETIKTAIKYRESKNLATSNNVTVGQTVYYTGPMGGKRKCKVLRFTPQYCVVNYQNREVYIKHDKIFSEV